MPLHAKSNKPKDIRILIDVSSSMAHNDSSNMRAAAMRMMAKVIPNGARVGVWMFSAETERLISPGRVGRGWSKDLYAAAERVHSNGQNSNLAEAIEVGSLGWIHPDATTERSMIIITDGLIEVSDEIAINRESREHVLGTLMPKLKDLGVRIHTIALTGEADVELLQKISYETDGYFTKLDSAEDLQKSFLKILDFSFVPDGVPIAEDKFKIDRNISEVTLMIFSNTVPEKKGESFIRLKAPNNIIYDYYDNPDNISWYEEGLANIITIANPQSGEWFAIGSVDLAKKIRVLTELNLEVNDLPGNLFEGELVYLQAMLTQKGKQVTDQDILKLTQVTAEVNPGSANAQIFKFNDAGKFADEHANDGKFNLVLGPLPPAPNQDLVVDVTLKTNTFARQKQQTAKLLPIPVAINSKTEVAQNGRQVIKIEAIPNAELIHPDSLEVKILLQDNQNKTIQYKMERSRDNENWSLLLSPEVDVTSYAAKFELHARALNGRKINILTPVYKISVPDVALPSAPEPIIIKQEITELTQEEIAMLTHQKDNALTGTKMIFLMFVFIFLNSIIWAMIYVGYKLLRQHQERKVNIISNKLR